MLNYLNNLSDYHLYVVGQDIIDAVGAEQLESEFISLIFEYGETTLDTAFLPEQRKYVRDEILTFVEANPAW